MSEPTIRIASCRSDGKCPECGLMQAGAPWPMLDYCACRICPPCLYLHLRDLLTEALRQLDFVLRQREQLREERDAAIEAQKRHLNEATEAVHDLGAKLDCALHDVAMWKGKVSGEADVLEKDRDEARAQVRAFQRAAEASVERQRGDAAIYQRNKERERAERAEALLREIAAVPLVGLTLGSVLLAKIREVVR